MRTGFIQAIVAIAVVGVASFFGGRYWEHAESRQMLEKVLTVTTATQHAHTLQLSRATLDALRRGDIAGADLNLVRMSKLDAAALAPCARSAACSAWLGKNMPTPAELAEIAAWNFNREDIKGGAK